MHTKPAHAWLTRVLALLTCGHCSLQCELLARKMGKKVHLDVTTCTLECGDGIKRPVHTSTPYMV